MIRFLTTPNHQCNVLLSAALFCCIIPHSHQNLGGLRSGADYSRFINNDTVDELITSFLRQLDVLKN